MISSITVLPLTHPAQHLFVPLLVVVSHTCEQQLPDRRRQYSGELVSHAPAGLNEFLKPGRSQAPLRSASSTTYGGHVQNLLDLHGS